METFSPSDKGKQNLVVRQKISGSQLGEFFGGCLTSVDLNGDGLDDLVVGSPLATFEEVRRKRSSTSGKYLKVNKHVLLHQS